jgi:hypothetical protein
VDSIGVGTIFRGSNCEAIKCNIVARKNHNMEIFTVLGSNVADEGVVKEIKTEILLKLNQKNTIRNVS